MNLEEFYKKKTLIEEVTPDMYDTAIELVKKIRKGLVKKSTGRDGKERSVAKKFPDTYFVGGWVRDKLLGLEPKDIDIATSAKPEEVKKILDGEKFIEIGESFNIVMVVLNGETFEIATFREDSKEHSDGRRPNSVSFSNAEGDAKRRDFTINALFYDPIEEKYVDYVGGQKDLEKKLLRAIGEPLERFSEDFLRLLRACRFAAQKGFKIEDSTFQAIKMSSSNIKNISKERIKMEMDKILMSEQPGYGLELLKDTGLLQELFPEISDFLRVD